MCTDLNTVMKRYTKDKEVTDKIKRGLRDGHGLDRFTTLPFDLSTYRSGEYSDVFQRYLSTKILAQTMINLHYNDSYFGNCSLDTNISDLLGTEGKKVLKDASSKNHLDIDQVVVSIVKYAVMHQILSKMEKEIRLEKCEYCDNVINEEDNRCYVCSGDDFIPRKFVAPSSTYGVRQENYGNIDLVHSRGGTEGPKCINDDNRPLKEYKVNITPNVTTKGPSIEERDRAPKNIVEVGGVTASKDINDWTCRQCSFVNKFGTKNCAVCFTIQKIGLANENTDDSNVMEGGVIVPTTWKCTFCSKMNLCDERMCVTCRSWRCDKCTFVNEELSIKCGTCGSRNYNLVPCSECSKTVVHVTLSDGKYRRCNKEFSNGAECEDGESEWTEVYVCKECLKNGMLKRDVQESEISLRGIMKTCVDYLLK